MARSSSRTSPRHALWHLLRERSALRGYIAIRAAEELASQMLNVAIGWYVYAATHDPMGLAYVGLAQFLPTVGLALVSGHAADRLDRRRLITFALLAQGVCLLGFCAWSTTQRPSASLVYLLLVVVGAARAFSSPAMSATLPSLTSGEEFPRAVAASSSAFQVCTLVGPALGGLLYTIGAPVVFAVSAALYLGATVQARRLVGGHRTALDERGATDKSVLGGARYIRKNRLLLALVSLDLFAVLLGGVTALLPIYAKDILRVGPAGLGCLRCAPGVGAAVVGLALAHRSVERGAGKRMLACVAGFGCATVVFAVSKDFWLSLAALAIAGGFDMVSMVIRQTLVQLATPDAMRGRVSAVYFVFVGASNEFGEFESGLAAAWLGTVPAALLGGLGTLAVVALWSRLFPELRGTDRLAPSTEDACAP